MSSKTRTRKDASQAEVARPIPRGPLQSPPFRCAAKDCHGIPVQSEEYCLAHLSPAGRDAFLAALKPGAQLNLVGVPIDSNLLARIIVATQAELGDSTFQDAQFIDGADFGRVQFKGNVSFIGAHFYGAAIFPGARFGGEALFNAAEFHLEAWFGGAKFRKDATFFRAHFNLYAFFGAARFGGFTSFEEVRFDGEALFDEADFGGLTGFGGAQFSSDARFSRCRFANVEVLGPLFAGTGLLLEYASFEKAVVIEASTPKLVCLETAFKEAATLRLRFAEIVLDGAHLAQGSTIAFAEDKFVKSPGYSPISLAGFFVRNDAPMRTWLHEPFQEAPLTAGGRSPVPRLLSLRRVDVAGLVLANLDLAACLFQGAHNLEQLRIEGPLRFAGAPMPWQIRLGRHWIPVWPRWMRREALAEEHLLRAHRSMQTKVDDPQRFKRPGWWPSTCRLPDWVSKVTGLPAQPLSAEVLAAIYRALRRGLEDQKNAPGASDFYYGEMEMRRLSRASLADRLVLWLYWLVSGYGLRASRALIAYAVAVALFAFAFWQWGFAHPHTYLTALLRSFESSTSVLRPPPPDLNYPGEVFDTVNRLVGATLLGLTVFSLRGRIKR